MLSHSYFSCEYRKGGDKLKKPIFKQRKTWITVIAVIFAIAAGAYYFISTYSADNQVSNKISLEQAAGYE